MKIMRLEDLLNRCQQQNSALKGKVDQYESNIAMESMRKASNLLGDNVSGDDVMTSNSSTLEQFLLMQR
jgi:hypothetical protein